ncbi:MAG TPA: ribonuclease P protein component [Acidobacteriaceae bacterium]|jgi:ribonuclease P protein component
MSANPNTAHRLRKHADYQLVYKNGRKQFGKQMAYFYALRAAAGASPDSASRTPSPSRLPLEITGPRVGLTVPKALGKAVDRNRIKRRMREAVKRNLPLLQAPVDLVLHPRRSAREVEFAALEREVGIVFRAVQAAVERASAQGAVSKARDAKAGKSKVDQQ